MTDVVVKRVVRHSLRCHVPSLLCLVQVSNNKRGKYGRALKCRQARKLGSAVNQIKFCLNRAQQLLQPGELIAAPTLIDICRRLSLATVLCSVFLHCALTIEQWTNFTLRRRVKVRHRRVAVGVSRPRSNCFKPPSFHVALPLELLSFYFAILQPSKVVNYFCIIPLPLGRVSKGCFRICECVTFRLLQTSFEIYTRPLKKPKCFGRKRRLGIGRARDFLWITNIIHWRYKSKHSTAVAILCKFMQKRFPSGHFPFLGG